MRPVEAFAVLALSCLASAPAIAQERIEFNIRGGRLSDALIAMAEQSGATIGSSDLRLAAVRSRPLRGRMTLRSALDRLLQGTGYSYVFVGPRAVRVDRAAPRRRRQPLPDRLPPPIPTALPDQPEQAIIVTASKLGVLRDLFGGTVRMIDLRAADTSRFGARGSESILERLPMLASTSLGPGRNKLFVRGIADSSFNGPSQSIIGQYLGDVRLTFNAPDPDLNQYDIGSVELLEGPQGTLYGTGALGGILRLVPNAADASRFAASLSTGVLATGHGGIGGDGAAMINVPIVADRLALRAVGYFSTDAGYINDVGRNLDDVNRTHVGGGRATLRFTPGDNWQLELGGLVQSIHGRDGQYAERDQPPMSRRSALAQPFDNDYQLGQFTLRRRWRGLDFISATGLVSHQLNTRFDATGLAGTVGPQLFSERNDITLVSNETRISRPSSRGEGWVFGWSLLHNINRISRSLGPPATPAAIAGVRNEFNETALFGQYSLALSQRVIATVGGRLTYSESDGRLLDANEEDDEPKRTDFRMSPTAALTWQARDRLIFFARFQQGFRAGGLAISPTGAPDAAQRFESDSLASVEAGLRLGRMGRDRFAFDATIAYSSWKDIQADLVDTRGLPYTTNLGDGRILSVELDARWRAAPWLTLNVAAFFNESRLTDPRPEFVNADLEGLPNTADSARVGAQFTTSLSPALSLAVDGSVRYVGESYLGAGGPVELEQGGFIEANVGARLDLGQFSVSLDIDNVGDARGNRFSFGNPFGLANGNQLTPLRPRTVRVGLDFAF